MKNNNMYGFFRLLPLVIFLSASLVPVRAQVQQYSNVHAYGSIVRHVNADRPTVLIYSQTDVAQGCFILNTSGNVQSFELPARMLVNDFEVDGDGNAWFCGDMAGTPVVGMFGIVDVFSGGDLHYTLCTATTEPVIPYSLTRMEVVRQGTATYVAAVGEGTPNVAVPTGNVAIVVSVQLDMSPPVWLWPYHLSYDKGESVSYTDIVALDNNIVAVGTDRRGYGCYAKVYNKAVNFPGSPRIWDDIITLQHTDMHEGKVLATKVIGDDASIVQYGDKRYSVANTLASFTMAGTVSGAQTLEATNPLPIPSGYSTTDMDLCEIRFSVSDRRSLVLHRGYHSLNASSPTAFAVDSWLLRFPVGTVSADTVWKLYLGVEHSLDTVAGGGVLTSGLDIGYGYLHTYNRVPFGGVCETPVVSAFRTPACTVGNITSVERDFRKTWYDVTFHPTVRPVTIQPDCGQ